MRITGLRPGDIVLSREGEGKQLKQIPLIVLGPSENNDSVVLLSAPALGRVQMRPRFDIGGYFHSTIDDYLETVFMDSTPYSLKQALAETEIHAGVSVKGTTVAMCDRRRVFLPSMNELGFRNVPEGGVNYIDALKAYSHTSLRSIARVAAENGSSEMSCYWTRSSPRSNIFYCITPEGNGFTAPQDSCDIWIRPCFSVSVDTEVAPVDKFNIHYYELVGAETKRRIIQEDLFMRIMTL